MSSNFIVLQCVVLEEQWFQLDIFVKHFGLLHLFEEVLKELSSASLGHAINKVTHKVRIVEQYGLVLLKALDEQRFVPGLGEVSETGRNESILMLV